MTSGKNRPLRVLLVDDHEIVRAGLRTVLAGTGMEIAGEASTVSEAIERAHARAVATPHVGDSELSAQEHRVLALVAEGKTNKEIALAMHLSPKTVKNYLSHIFQKLQVTRRSEAVARFARAAPPR